MIRGLVADVIIYYSSGTTYSHWHQMKTTTLQRFSAPDNGHLTKAMTEAIARDGVIILEDFVSESECLRLRERMLQLVDEFDAKSVRSVFSAMEQTQLGDKYFEESGDKIRYFFESEAFDDNGDLKQSKQDSLNKVGHAMHDLDSVFDGFSRTPKLANGSKSGLR